MPRIAQLEQAVNEDGLSALDKLVLVSSLDNAQARRGQLLGLQSDVLQHLALAENVEKAQVVEPAAAVKTTARSGRNGALVGGLIGLLLGCAAALLADPFLARRDRVKMSDRQTACGRRPMVEPPEARRGRRPRPDDEAAC